jgi:hypothetical protein
LLNGKRSSAVIAATVEFVLAEILIFLSQIMAEKAQHEAEEKAKGNNKKAPAGAN